MLRITKISFPGLGIGEFDVDSVAFSPFGVDIAWYALIITIGMVACVAFACYMAKKVGIEYEKNRCEDLDKLKKVSVQSTNVSRAFIVLGNLLLFCSSSASN